MHTEVKFLDCPAYLDQHGMERCELPAAVESRYAVSSTAGLLDSAKIRCPRGHWFNAPMEALTERNTGRSRATQHRSPSVAGHTTTGLARWPRSRRIPRPPQVLHDLGAVLCPKGPRWMPRFVLLTVIAVAVTAGAPVASLAAALAGTSQHGAITITSDSGFTPPGSATGCACVTAGNGTPSSPYVIGPWAITAPSGGSSGWAVKVDNSGGAVTSSFTITGISATYSGVPFTDPVIVLIDVNNASGTTISNISANEDGRGVELDSSAYISLDQLSFNKMTGNSVFINGSSHVTLSNSKLKSTGDGQVPHNADGLYALNSAYLSIGGVPACPKSQVCNSFDYNTGWGVYLQNTHDVTIDHASANADDTGAYILDNAWNVDLGNSTAQAGGPICITLNGQKTFTGYDSDQGGLLLVNGSHDNAIHDDQFAANTGYSIGSGGNGFFVNACAEANQPFSPAESPMGTGNRFTNVCYSSTDIAGLEPAQPCK